MLFTGIAQGGCGSATGCNWFTRLSNIYAARLTRYYARCHAGYAKPLNMSYVISPTESFWCQWRKKHAIRLGLTPEKLHVVANGITRQVTRSREEARRQLQLDNDKLYIGFIGRLVPQKDPASLIEAFARIAGRFELAHLVMLGDGPLSATLHGPAARLGVAATRTSTSSTPVNAYSR